MKEGPNQTRDDFMDFFSISKCYRNFEDKSHPGCLFNFSNSGLEQVTHMVMSLGSDRADILFFFFMQ
jgi:hypothetical protein